jgi:hypothetical protein
VTLRLALLPVWAAAAACTPPAEEPSVPDGPVAEAMEVRPGVRFDPATTAPGTAVGGLTVESVDARVAAGAGEVVGTARFSGELTLSGATMRHPDYPDVPAICFEADEASAARLPRWEGDERRAWFCFENHVTAASALAAPGEVRPATVTIDRFTIHRGLSDEVNTAVLVRVTARGEPPRSDHDRLRNGSIELRKSGEEPASAA